MSNHLASPNTRGLTAPAAAPPATPTATEPATAPAPPSAPSPVGSAVAQTYTAPSARQVLARTRRTINEIARISPGRRLTLAAVPETAAAACDKTLTAERIPAYQRSGRTHVLCGVHEYLWSYWPTTARPVGPALRSFIANLVTSLPNDDRSNDTTTDATLFGDPGIGHGVDWEAVTALDLQNTFSTHDPRLAWQLPDGSVVLDEIATNHHHSGLFGEYLHARFIADLAIGPLFARSIGGTFAGVRLLPLRRPPYEAALVTNPWADLSRLLRGSRRFEYQTLDVSVLAPQGSRMPAGLAR